MSITFESAMEQLKSMFPTWDEETMKEILTSNDYHVERTIEQLLAMSGEIDSSELQQQQPQTERRGSNPASAPGSRRGSGNSNERPRAAPAPRMAPSGERYRGIKVDLPEPFLRPPGWKAGGTIIADEELAMMLMDEDFQRQAREILGEDFMRELEQDRRRGARQQTPQRGAPPQQRRDSGIMTSLATLGSNTRSSLAQLAQRFSSTNKSANTGSAQRRGSRGTHLEEEDEVVTFDGGARSHLLNNGVANNDDDDENDVYDSENPLIRYNRSETANVTLNKKDK